MLGNKGIKGIYPTTVAKIESGERAVRIDEATALADLFEVSLDALLGRHQNSQEDELAYLLRLLRDTARDSSQQVGATMETIRDTWSTHLSAALGALIRLETLCAKLLRREQGRPELSEEALMDLEVPEDEAQP